MFFALKLLEAGSFDVVWRRRDLEILADDVTIDIDIQSSRTISTLHYCSHTSANKPITCTVSGRSHCCTLLASSKDCSPAASAGATPPTYHNIPAQQPWRLTPTSLSRPPSSPTSKHLSPPLLQSAPTAAHQPNSALSSQKPISYPQQTAARACASQTAQKLSWE